MSLQTTRSIIRGPVWLCIFLVMAVFFVCLLGSYLICNVIAQWCQRYSNMENNNKQYTKYMKEKVRKEHLFNAMCVQHHVILGSITLKGVL